MRALSRFLIVTFCAFVAAPTDAAGQWVQAYGGEGVSSFYSIQQAADGGYVAAGETGLGGGFANAWVVKVDTGGNIVWQKIYGGPGDEYAWSVHPTADGGYIVAGETDSVGAGERDAWLMKLDASGTAIWQETFGGRNFEALLAVQPTPDGGYLAVGRTNSFGAGSTDAWLLKLDASGRVTWQRTIGGKGYDVASSVSSAADGGHIVAGGTDSYGRGAADAWVLKLDADGNILWQSAYGGDRDDRAMSVQPTTDGGYVVAGDTRSFGAGGNDAWVLKLDGSGNVVWQRTYGGAGNEVAWSIAQIAGGGYVLAGSTDSFGAAGGDAWVLRLDASGNVVWQRTYGGASEDRAHSVRPTADGGYIVAGTTYSLGGVHAWLLKLDADGSIGGCAIAGTSNAAAMDSTALRVSGAATVLTSGTTPASILAAPVDSPAESRQICGSVGQVPVVEFYHASFDHFFITWMPGEIAKLDAGTEIRGWARTGYSFKTYTTAQAGASPVCRYYIPPALGDSHFFGRGTVECNETGQKNPSFMLEDPSFMQMHLPVAGVCPAGTAQVYRVFSNRPDANHRYMTDRTVRDQMVAKGWLAEGDGPDLVVMCAPN